jgi:acyl-CoA thioesterase FadM
MWWIRFLNFILAYRVRSKAHYLDEIETEFRVWPFDLDVNMHMNNGSYLSIMDFGRYDLIFRSGFIKTVMKLGLYPVVGSSTIRYRRPLKPLQIFFIRTKLIGWDDRFFYLQQQFVSKNEVTAMAVVKARFLKKRDNKGVSPQEVALAHDPLVVAPQVPSWVIDWTKAENQGWAKTGL